MNIQLVNGGGMSPSITRRVYYTGTDTLYEGYALCYNFDAVDVTAENLTLSAGEDEACPARRIQVEKPSFKNHAHFAGVVSNKSSGFTGPGFVEINVPGSVCNIYTQMSADHVWPSGMATGQMVTFTTSSYAFKYQGLAGAGSAVILATVDRSTTAGLVQAELMTGPQSGGVQEIQISTGANGTRTEEMLSATDAVCSLGGSIAVTPFGVTVLNVSLLDAALTATASLGNCPGKTSGAKLPIGAIKVFKSAYAVDQAKALTMVLSYVNTGSNSLMVAADNCSLALGSTVNDSAALQWNGVSWRLMGLSNGLNTFAS